ncbi:acetyl-CoA C-acyltransferase, partial [Streptomyces sp. NPDC059909]|uniref:thiolase family protein n=1 Tax=Streptomyces sp. NPDC059909 TaxID=3346998 RepID=UPI00364BD59E
MNPPHRATRPVAVLGGSRIPFARSDGPYATASNQQLLSAALGGLVERYGLTGERVGEFVAGAVLKHSRDFNLAREAVIAAANKIALGQTDSAIAGGSDTASDAPIGLNDRLRRILLEARRAKSAGARAKALAKVRPGHVVPDVPRNAEPRTHLSMGEHAAVTARAWGISREAQDELAATSHQRLAAAYERGLLDDLVVPFRGLARDQNLRPGSTPAELATLRPVFGTAHPGATMTAGNSTPLTDGAATVLLGSEEWAEARDLTPLAHLTWYETAAVDFVSGDVTDCVPEADGLLMAPTHAVPRL